MEGGKGWPALGDSWRPRGAVRADSGQVGRSLQLQPCPAVSQSPVISSEEGAVCVSPRVTLLACLPSCPCRPSSETCDLGHTGLTGRTSVPRPPLPDRVLLGASLGTSDGQRGLGLDPGRSTGSHGQWKPWAAWPGRPSRKMRSPREHRRAQGHSEWVSILPA